MTKNTTIICYPKCSTCKKAEKWLQEKGIKYNYRPIKEKNPTVEELKKWILKSDLPIKSFFNTSGILYREQNIKEKIKTSTQEELLQILASDGMMVKRPILLIGNQVLVGFNEKKWEENIQNK